MSANETWARRTADRFRVEHGLVDLPIKDVFEMIHSTMDVDVFSIAADDQEHGLSMLDPQTGLQVMVVATTAHPMRQRSTVAHELSHLLRGDLDGQEQWVPGDRSPAEVCADAFSRHLLLPLSAVRHRMSAVGRVSVAHLSDLVQEFDVSPAIAAIQLKEVGAIDDAVCEQWRGLASRHLAARFGWLNQYDDLSRSSAKRRAPQRLMRRAVAGYLAGILGLDELADWYGQSSESLRAELGEPPAMEHEGAEGDAWGLEEPLFPLDDGGGALA